MGRDPANRTEPNALPTATVGEASPPTKASTPSKLPAAEAPTEAAPQRYILPKNLSNAVKHLSDGELELMHVATVEEMRRRGRTLSVETDLPSRRDIAKMRSATTEKRGHVNIADIPLTRGQVNAVRSAFKAGITPSRIARQFGISQTNVRKALASDEPDR